MFGNILCDEILKYVSVKYLDELWAKPKFNAENDRIMDILIELDLVSEFPIRWDVKYDLSLLKLKLWSIYIHLSLLKIISSWYLCKTRIAWGSESSSTPVSNLTSTALSGS